MRREVATLPHIQARRAGTSGASISANAGPGAGVAGLAACGERAARSAGRREAQARNEELFAFMLLCISEYRKDVDDITV
jgi:hypothetical protein